MTNLIEHSVLSSQWIKLATNNLKNGNVICLKACVLDLYLLVYVSSVKFIYLQIIFFVYANIQTSQSAPDQQSRGLYCSRSAGLAWAKCLFKFT